MSFEVVGADRLARTLLAAADDLDDLTAAGNIAGARVLAAVRPPVDSGALARSITVDADATSATVYSTVVYAPVHEYGWPRRNIPARHYLEQASTATSSEQVDAYTAVVARAITKVRGS
jgi:phage gpG-like protein